MSPTRDLSPPKGWGRAGGGKVVAEIAEKLHAESTVVGLLATQAGANGAPALEGNLARLRRRLREMAAALDEVVRPPHLRRRRNDPARAS